MKRILKWAGFFRTLRRSYRVIFVDDESLQEVASFNLTMRKLYILISTLFVVVVVLTVCVLLLTPLKYYIPGYGSSKTYRQVVKMKRSVDSLSDLVAAQQLYETNIRKVVSGDYSGHPDTTMLSASQVKNANMTLFPAQAVKTQPVKKNIQGVKKRNISETSENE